MFADLAEDAARGSHRNDVRGDVLRDDAARADDGVVADGHAGHDEDAGAQPAVLSDVDRHVELVHEFAQFGKNRMSRRGEDAVRTEHGVVADVDVRVVHKGEIEYARNITVKGGALEVEAQKQAVYTTSGNAPALPSGYEIYTAKDGEIGSEYVAATYLKAVPCKHTNTEVVLEGSNYLTKCLHCGEVVDTVPCEHTETKVVVDGNDFVTVCAFCGAEQAREEAPALDAEYVLKMAGSGSSTSNQITLTLTNYYIPLYTKNVTRTDGQFIKDGVTYTADYVSQALADETDWNAKLIWHTGDEGPTLYLNGFVTDNYNEEYGFRYRIAG